jgi:hypothetical protein
MEAITISKEGKTITITTHFPEIGTSHTLETTDKERGSAILFGIYNR